MGNNIAFTSPSPSHSTNSIELKPESSGLTRLFTLKRCVRLLALALAVTVIWGVIFDRWRPSNWTTPVVYTWDALYYMGLIQHARNGDLLPFGYIHSKLVGAPFIGNLNDRPDAERSMLYLAGVISRGIGIMGTVNLMVICAHILAACSFYITARLWRVARPFAWSLSLPYSFINYGLVIQNAHLPYLFFGLLPLQLYSCWYISCAPSLKWGNPRFKLALLVGLLSGFLQIYFVFAYLLILAPSLARRFFARKPHLLRALIPAALTFCVTASALGSNLTYWYVHGRSTGTIDRSYHEMDSGALKPIDLAIPNQGQAFGLLDSISKKHSEGAKFITGEHHTTYLGLLALAGLALLLIRFTQRAVRRESIPIPFLMFLWVMATCTIGGLISLGALLSDFYLIRTISRYSTILSSIGLLYLAFTLSLYTRRRSTIFKVLLGTALLTFGLVDQAAWAFAQNKGSAARVAQEIQKDKVLVSKIEKSLPIQAMVFMLPVVVYPEQDIYFDLPDYELLRPILHSSKLRFSYGSNKGRPEADWQKNVALLPPGKLISALESYGFSGLLINRLGYKDRAAALVTELAEAGYSPSFEHDANWVFYRLAASTSPVRPIWASMHFHNWYPQEAGEGNWWRWTDQVDGAEIEIKDQQAGPRQITFSIVPAQAREISILLNDKLLTRLSGEKERQVSIIKNLKEGTNTLSFSTDKPAVQLSPSDSRPFTFNIKNINIETLPPYLIEFAQDWFSRESDGEGWWHWSGSLTESEVTIISSSDTQEHHISALVGALASRQVYVILNGELIETLSFEHQGEKTLSRGILLRQGENSLIFSTDKEPIQPSVQDTRLLAFYVKNLELLQKETTAD